MLYCVPFLEVCIPVFLSPVYLEQRESKKGIALNRISWEVIYDHVTQAPVSDAKIKSLLPSTRLGETCLKLLSFGVLNTFSASFCPAGSTCVSWRPAFLPRQTKHHFMLKDFPEHLGNCSCIFCLCLGEKCSCLSRLCCPIGSSLSLAWTVENREQLSTSTFTKGHYWNYFGRLRRIP